MKAIALLCLLYLGNIPVTAEDTRQPGRSAPAHRTPDLDFVNDTDRDDISGREKTNAPPAATSVKLAPASHSWIYLTLGFSAAAGGMALYFWESGKSSAPTKTVQVFTDAPD